MQPQSPPILLNDLAGFWEKGDRHHLCEARCGPFRQMVPVTFLPANIVQGHLAPPNLRLCRRDAADTLQTAVCPWFSKRDSEEVLR